MKRLPLEVVNKLITDYPENYSSLRLSTDISGFLLLNGKHPVTVSSLGPLGFHYELLGHVILLGRVVQSPIKLSQVKREF